MVSSSVLPTGGTTAAASMRISQALLSADVASVHPDYIEQSGRSGLNLNCGILSDRIGIRGLFRSYVWPTIVQVDYSADPAAAYFHGTSMPTLAEIMESGGRLSADITYVATAARYSRGYARLSARRRGGPGVVMAFDADVLEGALEATHYQPGMATGHHYRMLARSASERLAMSTFFQVTRDLPLHAQTDVSKMAVLTWLEAGRDAHDDKTEWTRWIDAWKHFSRID